MSEAKLYYFNFGYLHPEDWLASLQDDFEYESSAVVPILAEGKSDALQKGYRFAMWYVEQLFNVHPDVIQEAKEKFSAGSADGSPPDHGWTAVAFASWVDEELADESRELVETMPTLESDEMPDFKAVRAALQD